MDPLTGELDQLTLGAGGLKRFEHVAYERDGVAVFASGADERDDLHGRVLPGGVRGGEGATRPGSGARFG
jgi:hypothetical protein